jgi:S-adenosylmethionine:tRNA ribosyltransferase-isomerase
MSKYRFINNIVTEKTPLSIPEDHPDLLLKNYYYDLPAELIAARPTEKRADCRLLVYDKKAANTKHDFFYNIGKVLPKNSLIVFNQSKVFPSRLLAHKKTGGKAEVFVLANMADENGNVKSLVGTNSKKHIGDQYFFSDDEKFGAQISEVLEDGTFNLKFFPNITECLGRFASLPIPRYIREGNSDAQDNIDYQTVFARYVGSVAAPTAGLHFTPELLAELEDAGFDFAFVTLHVGLGTFLPVKSDHILQHNMHEEEFFLDLEDAKKIQNALDTNRPIIAVGTTTLRVLESAINGQRQLQLPAETVATTNIFLHPGKEIHSISGLITNFHLPESSLLMLVSSLIGRENCLRLYNEAIRQKYRFFSYGDAMYIQLDKV